MRSMSRNPSEGGAIDILGDGRYTAMVTGQMLPILEQLLVIQDRDRRITQLKAEQARIPSEIAAVDKRVQEESARLESDRRELKHIETERKKLEIDAESRRAQIARYKTQLTQIKSNTEYQALLKEITRAEEEISAGRGCRAGIDGEIRAASACVETGAGGAEGNDGQSRGGER